MLLRLLYIKCQHKSSGFGGDMKKSFLFLLCPLAVLTACGGMSGTFSVYEDPNITIEETETVYENEPEGSIYVYILGCVKNPGVYVFEHEVRLYEVINAAGGLTEDADLTGINPVTVLKDSAHLYIPSENETESTDVDSARESSVDTQKININTASATTLMTLPGVGRQKAEAIVDYRNSNGLFSDIEDIMKVNGIKEGVFEKIRDYLTVH